MKGTLMSDQRPRTGPARPTGIARHGRLNKPNPVLSVLRFLGISVAVVAVAATTVGTVATTTLVSSAQTFEMPDSTPGPPPNIGAMEGGFNILIVGSDTGAGQGGLGEGRSSTLNDVNILLHVSGDHTNAVAVSFPRDLVVPIPSCTRPDGSKVPGMSAQPINVTLYYGGIGCTIQTVEALTGTKIDFAGLITFTGVIQMSMAVGGVDVCLATDIDDKAVGLHLKKGVRTLQGLSALKFLRSRHGVGDGSDLTRISSQQVYLSALMRTVKSSETLTDFTKLFKIATAATKNMQLSSNLKNVDTMFSIAQSLKDIPLKNITFVQYPGVTGQKGVYTGKVAPVKAVADQLFAKIRADKPFKVAQAGDNRGSTKNNNATPLPEDTSTVAPNKGVPIIPGLKGQTAADQTCSVGFLQGTG
jgi:LCP family protein required for cell wall assembly